MRILLVLIGVVCIVLFFAGVFAPERSKRMQKWVAGKLRKGERTSDTPGLSGPARPAQVRSQAPRAGRKPPAACE